MRKLSRDGQIWQGILAEWKREKAANKDRLVKEAEMRDGQTENGKFIAVIRDSSKTFATNALRFETAEAAKAYAEDLSIRWTAVREYAVIPTDTPKDVDGFYWSREVVERTAIFGITTF